MRPAVALLLFIVATATYAGSNWQWSSKIAVSAAPQEGVFHHLDGSGRKHIAISKDKVAVIWEDDSGGSPQIYLATKNLDQSQFNQAVKLSTGNEAYEPAIAVLGDSGFVTVYEEDSVVYARYLSKDGLGMAIRLSTAKASQAGSASVASHGSYAYVVWREKYQHTYRLLVTDIELQDNNLPVVGEISQVETEALATPVLKPAIIATAAWVCIAWEDRREGHTRLLYSYSTLSDTEFAAPENLNEFFSARNEYDKGSGVTRLAMARFGEDEVLAAWMDKRRGGIGYGIFAAMGSESDQSFGPNEKAHGDNGDQQPHYNPAVAGNEAGEFIVAWHDFRNGDLDIWLSSYNDDDEWDSDYSPVVATGPGEQSHVSVSLDDNGGLHIVWIDRKDTSSPTRIWYSYAIAE